WAFSAMNFPLSTAFIVSHRFGFDLVDLSIGWNLPSSAFCMAGFIDRLGLFMVSQISWTFCVLSLHVHLCATVCLMLPGGQKRSLYLLELELQMVVSHTKVLLLSQSLIFAFSSGAAKLGYFPEQEID
ncbi:hypothetical protein STEG23_013548, partial [Scotinomys teguina]